MSGLARGIFVSAILSVLIITAPARAETLTGLPKVVDGDTLRIGERRIRLYGIDAPDERQTCLLDGRPWGCGRDATFALAYVVGYHWVTCEVREHRGELAIAVCHAGPEDLAESMVRAGFALAQQNVTGAYDDAEAAARRAKVGLWKSEFVKPWEWKPAESKLTP